MRKSISRTGFTIVELLIVIVVVGILASITLMQYRGVQEGARDAQRRSDIANITKALEQYYADNGRYPIPSGTTSVINSYWYSSGDSSWATFASNLTGIINTLPTDPSKIVNANPLTSSTGYAYAYYSGGNCGKAQGEWYLLVYRFEKDAKEQFTDGDCSTNPLGEGYYAGGVSFYRSLKN